MAGVLQSTLDIFSLLTLSSSFSSSAAAAVSIASFAATRNAGKRLVSASGAGLEYKCEYESS
jgi:hypothetical protein